MKRHHTSWLTLSLTAGLISSALAQTADPPRSAAPTAFHKVTAKLDSGGCLYGYLSTDQWLKGLSAKVGEIRTLILGLSDLRGEDRANVERVFDLLENLARHSGLESLAGVGVSGIAVEPDVYRTRLVLQRDPEAGGAGYLWSWFGGEAHPLAWQNGLPADTVYAFGLDLDLQAAWTAAVQEAERANLAELVTGMSDVSRQVQDLTGSSLEEHLASYAGEIGLALVLHPTRTFAVPLPGGGAVELPEPSLAVALRVKDDRLFRFCEAALAGNPASEQGEADGARWRTMPASSGVPFPFAPTVAQVGDTFWLVSTPGLFQELLQVPTGKASGLRDTPEFARFARGLPREGNSWAYVSQRFTRALLQVQQAALQQAAGGAGGAATMELMQRLFGFASAQASYSVGWQDEDGAQSVTQGTQDPAAVLVGTVAAPSAVLAGMLLPALAKSRTKAQEIACLNNLKQIALALRIYAVDHEDTFPPDLKSVEAELSTTRILVCPMDAANASLAGQPWSGFDFARSSYEYLEPGMKEGAKPPNTPVVRCRIHGFVAQADGSVQRNPR